ncbi:MAG: hypothetical protein ACKVH8_22240 [Pirellulales bacterium]
MLIAKCPECHDPIRIPELATEASRACCPWCQQTYYLADVFETLPPVVEIVEGPGSDQGGVHDEIISAESTPSYGLIDENAPASDFNFQESNSTGSSGAPTAKIQRSDRKPKKQSSGAFEMVKIIGGGVAGCVIAVSVVWYGLGKQMGFEKNLPGWTYVIVPEAIRTDAMREAAGNANAVPNEPQTENQSSNAPTQMLSVQDETTSTEELKMPETELGNAFQQALENSTEEDKSKRKKRSTKTKDQEEKAEIDQTPLEEPLVEIELPLELPDFESDLDQDLTDLVDDLSLELGPIGAEIPTPEEIEAANSVEEEGTDEKEVEEEKVEEEVEAPAEDE